MMDTGGLSLDQAPPIDIPARFFLTAPLFAIAAGLLLAWQGPTLLVSRWMPGALAATHLIAIGYLGLIMCGALLQMLPVIAGAPVPAVRLVGTLTHLLLTCGAAGLALGLGGGDSAALLAGGVSAGLGFLAFVFPAAIALVRARGVPGTLLALRAAAIALVVTVILGLLLVAVVLGWPRLPDFSRAVDAHAAWGLMGWVGLLVIGVAIQVLPMFYVTPAYPAPMRRWLAPALLIGIAGASVAWIIGDALLGRLLFGATGLGFVGFAVTTLVLIRRRQRPRLDPTLIHWWSAMLSLCMAAVSWAFAAPPTLVGVLLLVGLGVGLPAGMLFKIMPFLTWFHLQHRQLAAGRFDLRIPHMGGLLSIRWAQAQVGLHLLALGLLCGAVFVPALARPGGLILALSSAVLLVLLIGVARTYRRFAERLAL
ncbi:conserved membrane hypothetical protein [Thiocapsa sp. KS1]|nr:hypothetical protein [Thiocapsa sp. KS1]CRI63883.1 conserved membrane hypothetical protein [Thiocapsa sp. KS1]